ncbi:MAG TPA: hypothetical protein VMU34_15190, partial [Mycobacterium sp.]|nr:hypothetical protein [Mycobacterium sp.]
MPTTVDTNGRPVPPSLTITLTDNLTFTPTGSTTPNNIPTSLVIVGQVGGGLGGGGTSAPGPVPHAPQSVTWAVAGNDSGAQFNPPVQPSRVQSFGSEAAVGKAASLTWSNLAPGTYLLESGTHPSIQGPMGLYGIIVVTAPPKAGVAGTAYSGVSYDAEVPVLLSEIDPIQNAAVAAAVNSAGFSENAVVALTNKNNSVTSISVNSGGSGYKVGDVVNITGGSGSGATASVGTVDPNGAILTVLVNNGGSGYSSTPSAVAHSASGGTGASLAAVLSNVSAGPQCIDLNGSPAVCYPPAVNYNPTYFLMNGVAFDKTNVTASTFTTTPASIASPAATGVPGGNVLVRLVNAGLRMHVPSIVGSITAATAASPAGAGGFSLIAEDGNVLPGVPRVQSEVFMAAGKTYDVMINGPTAANAPALPIYDRQLSLSGNAVNRDAGMIAYIGVNGGTAPTSGTTAAATANPDTYTSIIAGKTFTVSDPSKGVIANDINVYGVRLTGNPTKGSVTLNSNGTFSYVPTASAWTASNTTDTFSYCANNSTSACTTVTLSAAPIEVGGITLANTSWTSNVQTLFTSPPPGVLTGASDKAGYPLTAVAASLAVPSGLSVSLGTNGSFNATATAAGTYTFQFAAQNSQGTYSTGGTTLTPCSLTKAVSGCAQATVVFPAGSGLTVTLIDGATGKPFDDSTGSTTGLTHPGDYRWIIEEDRTFFVNPNCAVNPPPAGCPGAGGKLVPTFGTNFHTSDMPFVAQGCTGPVSCEAGQTVYDPASGSHLPAVCDIGDGVCRTDASAVAGRLPVLPSHVALDPNKRYYISILPGDAANPFASGYAGSPCYNSSTSSNQPPTSSCAIGYGMGGTTIAAGQKAVTVPIQPSPYPP